MSRRGWVGFLRAGSALGLLVIASAQVNAGGFAIHEQSVYGQGTSFAGIAAGGALSSMFWNPATMTQVPGIMSETDVTGIFPYTKHSPDAGSTLLPFGFGGTTNTSDAGLAPGSYFSYQVNPNLWLGLSINAPFGLSVSMPLIWAGRDYGAGDSHIKTYNAAPSIAYRINDWISVGAGVQIQYADALLGTGPTPFIPGAGFVPLNADLSAKGWGYGFTAGVTLTPTPTTTIGLGYRSAINQKISGTLESTVTPAFGIESTVDLPDTVSLGIRQRIDPRWTLMGTAEWTNWSRIGTANVTSGGVTVIQLPFEYRDGWFFSVGAEYQWTDRLAVRGGVGYEISPITESVRIPILPDNNRVWLSVGATWQVWKGFNFDLAYSHVFYQDASINISAASGNPWFDGITYIGDAKPHADVLSLALVLALSPAAR